MGASKGLSGSGARSIGVRSVPRQEPSGLGLEPHSEASSLQWLARGHQGEKTGKFPSDLGDGSEALSTPGESDGRLGGRL